MADGMTTTGRAEMVAATNALPDRVTAALRSVARDTAIRVMNNARRLVPVDSGITRDSIKVTPDLPNKMYVVEVGPAPHNKRTGRTANFGMLPVWLEYGTQKMHARPFMRPAAEAEDARYRSDMMTASEAVARDVFKD